jgi:ribosomal protein S10
MIDPTTTILLAQRGGDLGDIIVLLVIVAASVFGAAGKWIAKQINEKREREAQLRRGGDPLAVSPKPSTRPPLEVAKPLPPRPVPGEANVPPLASPFPPSVRRVLERIQTSSGDAPTMDRVLEAILERATGVKIERKAPPPAPPPTRVRSAPRPPAIARKASGVPQQARSMSIDERERRQAEKLAEKRTQAELEAARIAGSEQQLSRDTDRRLGHVETHIEAFHRDEARGESGATAQADLFDRVSIQDAIVLSEILAPPLALRGPIGLLC